MPVVQIFLFNCGLKGIDSLGRYIIAAFDDSLVICSSYINFQKRGAESLHAVFLMFLWKPFLSGARAPRRTQATLVWHLNFFSAFLFDISHIYKLHYRKYSSVQDAHLPPLP